VTGFVSAWWPLAQAQFVRTRRDDAKRALLGATLEGVPMPELERAGKRFADRIASRSLRPDVVERLRHHQRRGDETVFVSAALEVYLRPLADHLGVETVIATRLEVDAHGRCTGRIAGDNVRGVVKAQLLSTHIGADPPFVWAYGNSGDDAQLLAIADVGIRVGRTPVAAEAQPPLVTS
jgi:HAD superfamily phosphoserine phosphatase-like hydrolase